MLRLLLACFLKVVGFTTEEIAAFARRSEMYRQVEVQFFRDWQLQALGSSRRGGDGRRASVVAQRQREIGIRIALGAGYGEVRRMFVREALALLAIGVAIGLPAAAVLTRVMESQLFGISPLDPATHLAVAFGLVIAAGLASYISARRASALDPIEVLKGV